MSEADVGDGVVASQLGAGNGRLGNARPRNAPPDASSIIDAGFLKPEDAKRSGKVCMQQREAKRAKSG